MQKFGEAPVVSQDRADFTANEETLTKLSGKKIGDMSAEEANTFMSARKANKALMDKAQDEAELENSAFDAHKIAEAEALAVANTEERLKALGADKSIDEMTDEEVEVFLVAKSAQEQSSTESPEVAVDKIGAEAESPQVTETPAELAVVAKKKAAEDATEIKDVRERLRQKFEDAGLGEASLNRTAGQEAQRIADNQKVAKVRESLGLLPEAVHQPGYDTSFGRGKLTETEERYNGFGQKRGGPRTEYAEREADRKKEVERLQQRASFAQSVGADVPDIKLPNVSDQEFDKKSTEISSRINTAINTQYEAFGRSLTQEPEIAKLLSEFGVAKREAVAATSGDFGTLNDAKNGSFEPKFTQRIKLVFGGSKIVEKGQATLRRVREIQDEIVVEVIKKYEAAGWNRDVSLGLTPETTNLRRVEEVTGMTLQ